MLLVSTTRLLVHALPIRSGAQQEQRHFFRQEPFTLPGLHMQFFGSEDEIAL